MFQVLDISQQRKLLYKLMKICVLRWICVFIARIIFISLIGHVNVGGRILFQHLIDTPWEKPPIPEYLCSTHGNTDWRFIQFDMITVLERLR